MRISFLLTCRDNSDRVEDDNEKLIEKSRFRRRSSLSRRDDTSTLDVPTCSRQSVCLGRVAIRTAVFALIGSSNVVYMYTASRCVRHAQQLGTNIMQINSHFARHRTHVVTCARCSIVESLVRSYEEARERERQRAKDTDKHRRKPSRS